LNLRPRIRALKVKERNTTIVRNSMTKEKDISVGG
jgi:hypothetical protein